MIKKLIVFIGLVSFYYGHSQVDIGINVGLPISYWSKNDSSFSSALDIEYIGGKYEKSTLKLSSGLVYIKSTNEYLKDGMYFPLAITVETRIFGELNFGGSVGFGIGGVGFAGFYYRPYLVHELSNLANILLSYRSVGRVGDSYAYLELGVSFKLWDK